MRPYKALTPLLLVAAAGCADLDVTNPSQRTAETFFRNRDDALLAVNAAYHGLQELGAFGRWLVFADDMRSDIAFSRSPWPELANFTRTVLASYDFEVNIHLYTHNYRTIYAANQVIARVPEVQMDATERARLVGEAKFIRALSYYNLVTLFGNVPLVLEPLTTTDRPAAATPEQIWAQIEADLTEARTALPASYTGNDVGRATSGAAAALLGKAHLQQREWADAATRFGEVVSSNRYTLMPNYQDNFREATDNNAESIFEIQFTDQNVLAEGSAGYSGPKLYGPCGPAFCDANPTPWYFRQFFRDNPAVPDPRLEFTIFYNKPGGMDVFGTPFATRYADRLADADTLNDLFPKKYTQWYKTGDEFFDNPINFKVMRLGGIKLLYAEALVQSGQVEPARTQLNQVRARVGLPARPAASQTQMFDWIEHEQLMELGFEAERFRFLQRHDRLTAANLPTLISHDPTFADYPVASNGLLPIPTAETGLNPNVPQNPGWGGN